MALDPDILRLMPDVVQVAAWTGQDAATAPSHGPAVAYPARVERRVRAVRTTTGQEVISTTQIYLASAPSIGPKDKLTLPDGTTPVILAIMTYPDEQAQGYAVLYTP